MLNTLPDALCQMSFEGEKLEEQRNSFAYSPEMTEEALKEKTELSAIGSVS